MAAVVPGFVPVEMKHSINHNFWAWAVLVLLTASTGLIAFSLNASAVLALVMITFASVKVLLVAWQFMELKAAHRAWLAILAVVLSIYGGIVMVLYGQLLSGI